MFGKKIVLSQDTLKQLYEIQCILESVFVREKTRVKDCTFETRRDWTIVGEGKFYTTKCHGHFLRAGKSHKVYVEITRRYEGGQETGRRGVVSIDDGVPIHIS